MWLIWDYVPPLYLFKFSFSCLFLHYKISITLYILVLLFAYLLHFSGCNLLLRVIVWWRSLSDSFFVLRKFHALKHIWIDFFINLSSLLKWFFQTLIRTHYNEILTGGLILWTHVAIWTKSIILFISWLSVGRRWHIFSIYRILLETFISHLRTIACHSILHKLIELIDGDMLEWTIISLTHKPHKNLLVCILFSLWIG